MTHVFFLILALFSASTPAVVPVNPAAETLSVTVTSDGTRMVWPCPEPQPLELPGGLVGWTSSGCAGSGPSGSILLPSTSVFLAVPPGEEPVLTVTAEGIARLGSGSVGEVVVTSSGTDSVFAALQSDLPSTWGEVVHSGMFRRAGVVRVTLHPVIAEPGGDLFSARRLLVSLEHPGAEPPSRVSGSEAAVLSGLLAGGDSAWRIPAGSREDSPFWGLPWVAMEIDTAGVYAVSSTDVPDAVGSPSATLALFCGRGREMGEDPWETVYSPRSVPILVSDGGDGYFDQGDSIFFFARGLAWWEPDGTSTPVHFNHRYAENNVYWFTWGGEPGARMELIDGGLTGATALPDSFPGRMHIERNLYLTRTEEEITVNMPDDWAWDRSSGSTSQWFYYPFDSPGATGGGTVRVHLRSTDYTIHHVQFTMNGTVVCDTTWRYLDDFVAEFPCSGIAPGSNTLGLHLIREQGNETFLFDWFEVFPWTDHSVTGQVQLPLEWWSGTGRTKLDWELGLAGARVFLVSGDTLAASVQLPGGNAFEFEVPGGWLSSELWMVPSGTVSSPVSVQERSPGRVMETLSGADRLYVAADIFMDDLAPLLEAPGQAQAVSTIEVYDELNGGVRDPGAIRALVSLAVNGWTPIPTDVVLVGTGTWDPRHFSSTRISYVDILYSNAGSALVTDDRFSMVEADSILPQAAVSRIAVSARADLQMLADRTAEYRLGGSRGEWQTSMIAAADDERSPLYSLDERFHTQGMERLLADHVPATLLPEKMYLIFYPFNDLWKKPEAREDFIEMWSEGSLLTLYMGHGGYDQLADEGLLYLEDTGLLDCQGRLPLAIFGSCKVGQFMNPSLGCLGQAVTISSAGGAVVSTAATCNTSGLQNEFLVGAMLDHLFAGPGISIGMSLLQGKLTSGYTSNAAPYITFGDGSIHLAYPWTGFQAGPDSLLTGEWSVLEGSGPEEGLVLVEAFESCRMDTYFTYRQQLVIEYLSQARCFFRGGAPASPDFVTGTFVPVDAVPGELARTQFAFLNDGMIAACSTYPGFLGSGTPAPGDSTGPDIELWLDGHRGVDLPRVSGLLTVRAVLSDSSGINLLGGAGRQLALYIDGVPDDVSRFFRYDQGSWITGELTVSMGSLQQGEHELELRASDGLLNRSSVTLPFTVTSETVLGISDLFPYPNPCDEGVSLNWTQTSPGTVDISVFTVTGRRVLLMGNIEGVAGYNQQYWDCRDGDGDPVASGSYIFLVSAASSGSTDQVLSEASGIIAVVRGSR